MMRMMMMIMMMMIIIIIMMTTMLMMILTMIPLSRCDHHCKHGKSKRAQTRLSLRGKRTVRPGNRVTPAGSSEFDNGQDVFTEKDHNIKQLLWHGIASSTNGGREGLCLSFPRAYAPYSVGHPKHQYYNAVVRLSHHLLCLSSALTVQ